MAIAPKFKPGQLVKYNHPANSTLGLVKSTQFARRRGKPVLVLVQWCNGRNTEEYIFQKDLTLAEDV
tara:strand:+ start:217 stop:417 length:201 start_codon:yes stop_codon:yes gene_type:complete